jgi:hypothetical protein
MQLITVNHAGSDICVLINNNITSHCCWLNNNEILVFCELKDE